MTVIVTTGIKLNNGKAKQSFYFKDNSARYYLGDKSEPLSGKYSAVIRQFAYMKQS